MENIIKEITVHALGKTPEVLDQITDKGKRNHVFKIRVDNDFYILRVNNVIDRRGLYEKEKWCYEQVKDLNIFVPKIFETGLFNE